MFIWTLKKKKILESYIFNIINNYVIKNTHVNLSNNKNEKDVNDLLYGNLFDQSKNVESTNSVIILRTV